MWFDNCLKISKGYILLLTLSFSTGGFLFSASNEDNPEQTYIITSQPYYLSGNTLHYVAHLFNYKTGGIDVPSRILITELLDSDASLIFQHLHSMIQGSSAGSYLLPDTLKTGCYWIRAYTRYQIGFTENLIHYLPVIIINRLDLTNPFILDEKLTFSERNIKRQIESKNNNKKPDPENRQFSGNIMVEIIQGEKNPAVREAVNLKIRITDQNEEPVYTRFTIAIRARDQFDSELLKPRNILEYRALMGSQIRYQIGKRATQTDTSSSVTQYNQSRIGQARYKPLNELRLRGRYVDPESKEVLSFRAISLTQTGQKPGFKLLFTDRDGKFEFNRLNFTNRENLLVLNAGEHEGIIIENELIQPSFSPPFIMGNYARTEVFRQYIKKREIDMQFKKFYNKPRKMNQDTLDENQLSRFRIYEKPDRSYDLDDYIQLTDMREVIIELLPNVKIFNENDQTRIRIFYHQNADMLPDPLFLVNGRIVKDNDFILNMDNRNVDKIEVLYDKTTLEPFGPLGIGGVVAFYTKEPIHIPYGLYIDLEGYHEPIERIVQYKSEGINSSNYPDFNPLLFWNPDCKTNVDGLEDITFSTNDLVSDFEIIIEGITKDGIPFFKQDVLSVKKPIQP